MEEDPIKEAVPTEPEQTTPAPEVAPPAVTPDSGLAATVNELSAKVDALTESLNTVLSNLSTKPDSTPVKKPWTHYGS